MRRIVWGATAALVALAPRIASSEPDRHEAYAFLAGDIWPAPQAGGQGIAFLGWRWRGSSLTAYATYNTDTVRLGVDAVCISDRACFGAEVRGQLRFAGLLANYFVDGQRIAAFGLSASYLAATLQGRFRPLDRWHVHLRSTARRWFFGRTDTTASVILPPDTWAFEQQAHLTYWAFDPDPSAREPHRPSWRLRGFGFGLQANYHHRLDARPWGVGVDESPSPSVAGRNRPDRNLAFVRQWAAIGIRLVDRWRLQLTERAGWGWGQDDLTRARIGGLNPYVIAIAGVPWAAFIADRYFAGQATLHYRLFDDVEVGLQLDAVGLRDIRRVDNDALGAAVGVGAFADARIGPWQGELRIGYSPDVGGWQADGPHVSLFVLVGRVFVL